MNSLGVDQQRQGSSQGQKTWRLPRSWSLAIAITYFCLLLAMIVAAWLEAERLRTLSLWVLVLGLFWAGKLLRHALEERVAAIHTAVLGLCAAALCCLLVWTLPLGVLLSLSSPSIRQDALRTTSPFTSAYRPSLRLHTMEVPSQPYNYLEAEQGPPSPLLS